MTLSGKVSLKVKMTILIIEILIIGSYGVVVGAKNMGAIRNDAIASMEEYVSEEHPEYSQEEIQQELQPILQKMQQEKKAKQDQFFYFMVIMCILTDIWVLYLTFDITSGVKRSALFAKKMGQGDFTQRVEEKYLKREDEIGILARSIRDIHHNMRHLIGYVQREADTLDETVGTAETALAKLADLVRELCNLRNRGMDVCLVSSGAIAVGRQSLGMTERPRELSTKQACAAVGQARLMMIYQKLFSEYNQLSAQILMTKNTMVNNVNRKNAQNTFDELLSLGVIPIVNENDSISTYELQNLEKFGDNDTLSAMVAALVRADLLILLSDIDGLFTDDPNTNPDAKFIDVVENLDDNLLNMGKGTSGSKVGTGGMATKLTAAQIASAAGVDMVIANGADFHIIHKITEGRRYGTLFVSQSKEEVYLIDIIDRLL